MEKMQKWEGNGKKVYDYDKNDWANPVYADLEKDLRDTLLLCISSTWREGAQG